jgi:hypothetical protein
MAVNITLAPPLLRHGWKSIEYAPSKRHPMTDSHTYRSSDSSVPVNLRSDRFQQPPHPSAPAPTLAKNTATTLNIILRILFMNSPVFSARLASRWNYCCSSFSISRLIVTTSLIVSLRFDCGARLEGVARSRLDSTRA